MAKDKDSVKELLISTATDLFSKTGYLDTSIREIGEAARVHPSLVYHYFKNKEHILYTIIERFSIYLINSLQEIQTKEADPVEGLRKMILRHLHLSHEFKKEVMITLREVELLKTRQKSEVMSFQRRIYNLYLDQLKKLERLNLLKQGNLTVITFSIFGVINWFYRWYKEDRDLDNDQIADQVVKNVFWGILNSNGISEGVKV